MTMKTKHLLLFLLLALTACKKQNDETAHFSEARAEMEAQGCKSLSTARALLAEGNFTAARDTLLQMRENYPLALNAREEGILLMDSIDLGESQMLLSNIDKQLHTTGLPTAVHDSLQNNFEELHQKVKFYQRKLRHDKENTRKH